MNGNLALVVLFEVDQQPLELSRFLGEVQIKIYMGIYQLIYENKFLMYYEFDKLTGTIPNLSDLPKDAWGAYYPEMC